MKSIGHSTPDSRRRTFNSIVTALVAAFTLFTAPASAPAQTGWGNALWLDGLDDYVSVDPGVVFSNTSFTLEFRAQQVGIPGFQAVVSQGITGGLLFGFNQGSRVTFRIGIDGLDATVTGDSLWHHWAFTYNAADRARKIFRDGVQVAFDTASTDYQGSGALFLGRFAGDPAYAFAGRLDEVRIWNVARTGPEILAGTRQPLSGTESNLVACWNFDEGIGTTVHDVTPLGHTGMIVGDPEWMRTTPGGHVLSLSSLNQYVGATIPLLASNYTVSAWIFLRTGGSPTSPVGVLSAVPCGGSAELLVQSLAGGSSTTPQYLNLGRCGAFGGTLSSGRVPTNQWVHVAVTVSTNKQVNYFIDGVAVGSWDGSSGDLSIGPSITLAANNGTTGRRFNGLLDEVQIWNIARTQADIVADYAHPRGATDVNLVAYYRFDEGTGGTVYDGTGNLPDDMLINTPGWNWQTQTLPYPVTLPAYGTSVSAAVLNGQANPNGLETTAWFEWGTSTSYGISTAATNVGSGIGLVSLGRAVDALAVGTTYHYRVVASNSLGIAYGADRTFNILISNFQLAQAVANAASGDIIVVTNDMQVLDLLAELVIDKDLSIVGPGASSLWIHGSPVHDERVLNIRSNVMVRISDVTITGGRAPRGEWGATAGAAGSPGEHGGGIYNAGRLTLTDCVLYGNHAGEGGYGEDGVDKGRDGGNGGIGGNGGAGGGGGGIYNAPSGVLWLDRCALRENRSGAGGFAGSGGNGGNSEGVPGAGGNSGSGGNGGPGAGLLNDGWAKLNNCTVSGNQTGRGGSAGEYAGQGGHNLVNWLGIHLHWGGNGGYGGTGGSGGSGGGVSGDGYTILNNCTISGNETGSAAPGGNGGYGGSSSGIGVDWGHVGGGGNGGHGGTGAGIFNTNSGILELRSCTIADNSTGLGAAGGQPGTYGTTGGGPGLPGTDGETGGIHNGGAQSPSIVNTVVGQNTGAAYNGANNDDVVGLFASQGHNLVGTLSSGTTGFNMDGDVRGLDPLLGPLANNGGPTLTQEPHPTSPLINSGHNRGAAATDQRGLPIPDPSVPHLLCVAPAEWPGHRRFGGLPGSRW